MSRPLNIYQRINEVRKVVNYAQKDRTVTGGGSYKAISHDAVTALIRNHLIDNGIVIVPSVIESKTVDTGTTTQGGTPMIRYEARFEIAFVNEDNPDDRAIVVQDAHANDYGDKAPGKATSYATKYAVLKLFSIETGENEESRIEAYADHASVSAYQAQAIEKLIEEVVLDRAKFTTWLVSAAGTDQVAEIPERKYDLVIKQLESMRNKPASKKTSEKAAPSASEAASAGGSSGGSATTTSSK